MLKKILVQAGICVLIAFVLFAAKHSGIDSLQRGTESVLDYMSVSYTEDDLKAFAGKTTEAFSLLTGKTTEAVDVMTGKPVYGEPIDDEYEGDETAVYAVGGGKVTAVGENEEIGKYVKIVHGDQSESLYGNLKSVRVSTPVRVKKGQIIGVYEKIEGKDFYYSFKEF